MKFKLPLLLISILFTLGVSAFVKNDDPIALLLKKLEDFTKKYPQEKIHLHLDKPYYAIGDNIWFKVYVVDTKNSAPTTISNIVYVELINGENKIERQLKLPMQSGVTWGDFKLTDSLSEGNYRIRAYTQWMRNAGPEFFFDKTIKIGNSWANEVFTTTTSKIILKDNTENVISTIRFLDKKDNPYANTGVVYDVKLNGKEIAKGKTSTNTDGTINVNYNNKDLEGQKTGSITVVITLPNGKKVEKIIPIKTTSTAVDVQFFPEGGSLVAGLPSKIAVKAVNSYGLGENISGKIIDNENNEVLKFETEYLGMGAFILNPLLGKTYSAIVTMRDGTEKTILLPKIETSGYVLGVNNIDSSKINIKVLLTEDLVNKGDLSLIAQRNGNVYFSTKIPSAKQLATLTLPINELPSGIVQFTLFSSANQPICERLAFINNSIDKIKITAANLKPSFKPRENVDFNILTSLNNTALQGSFSIAVTNETITTPDLENESNIFTRLLLTSDLVGYVEKPNHYFINQNSTTRTQLDNLLLTQGWRKINWSTLLNDQPLSWSYKPETKIQISGTISKGGKPVANGKVTLLSSNAGLFAIDTLSDEAGRFVFDNFEFGDSTKFIVQARTDKDNPNLKIDLDTVRNQIVTLNKNTGDIEVNVNTVLMSYLNQTDQYFNEQVKRGFLNKTIQLKEVKIIEVKKPVLTNSTNLNGPGNADKIISAKELETATSLSQYIQGRVAGVIVRNGLIYSTRSGSFSGTFPMAVVLDGMMMGNDFQTDNISVRDIETVEVLRTIGYTSIYGVNGGSGVLVITTKRGSDLNTYYNRYSPGIVNYTPKGFSAIRQFYSPKYTATPDPKPDLRTTVYWNPHLSSKPDGTKNINYFNTDQQGKYRIVVEGIDGLGNIGRNVFTYTVD